MRPLLSSAGRSHYFPLTGTHFARAAAPASLPPNPALFPANGAKDISPDVQLKIQFATAPTVGTGKIQIFDIVTDTLVESIDVATPTLSMQGRKILSRYHQWQRSHHTPVPRTRLRQILLHHHRPHRLHRRRVHGYCQVQLAILHPPRRPNSSTNHDRLDNSGVSASLLMAASLDFIPDSNSKFPPHS